MKFRRNRVQSLSSPSPLPKRTIHIRKTTPVEGASPASRAPSLVKLSPAEKAMLIHLINFNSKLTNLAEINRGAFMIFTYINNIFLKNPHANQIDLTGKIDATPQAQALLDRVNRAYIEGNPPSVQITDDAPPVLQTPPNVQREAAPQIVPALLIPGWSYVGSLAKLAALPARSMTALSPDVKDQNFSTIVSTIAHNFSEAFPELSSSESAFWGIMMAGQIVNTDKSVTRSETETTAIQAAQALYRIFTENKSILTTGCDDTADVLPAFIKTNSPILKAMDQAISAAVLNFVQAVIPDDESAPGAVQDAVDSYLSGAGDSLILAALEAAQEKYPDNDAIQLARTVVNQGLPLSSEALASRYDAIDRPPTLLPPPILLPELLSAVPHVPFSRPPLPLRGLAHPSLPPSPAPSPIQSAQDVLALFFRYQPQLRWDTASESIYWSTFLLCKDQLTQQSSVSSPNPEILKDTLASLKRSLDLINFNSQDPRCSCFEELKEAFNQLVKPYQFPTVPCTAAIPSIPYTTLSSGTTVVEAPPSGSWPSTVGFALNPDVLTPSFLPPADPLPSLPPVISERSTLQAEYSAMQRERSQLSDRTLDAAQVAAKKSAPPPPLPSRRPSVLSPVEDEEEEDAAAAAAEEGISAVSSSDDDAEDPFESVSVTWDKPLQFQGAQFTLAPIADRGDCMFLSFLRAFTANDTVKRLDVSAIDQQYPQFMAQCRTLFPSMPDDTIVRKLFVLSPADFKNPQPESDIAKFVQALRNLTGASLKSESSPDIKKGLFADFMFGHVPLGLESIFEGDMLTKATQLRRDGERAVHALAQEVEAYFCGAGFSKYCDFIASQGNYGGPLELKYLSAAFGVKIDIVDCNLGSQPKGAPPERITKVDTTSVPYTGIAGSPTTLYLARIFMGADSIGHYDGVVCAAGQPRQAPLPASPRQPRLPAKSPAARPPLVSTLSISTIVGKKLSLEINQEQIRTVADLKAKFIKENPSYQNTQFYFFAGRKLGDEEELVNTGLFQQTMIYLTIETEASSKPSTSVSDQPKINVRQLIAQKRLYEDVQNINTLSKDELFAIQDYFRVHGLQVADFSAAYSPSKGQDLMPPAPQDRQLFDTISARLFEVISEEQAHQANKEATIQFFCDQTRRYDQTVDFWNQKNPFLLRPSSEAQSLITATKEKTRDLKQRIVLATSFMPVIQMQGLVRNLNLADLDFIIDFYYKSEAPVTEKEQFFFDFVFARAFKLHQIEEELLLLEPTDTSPKLFSLKYQYEKIFRRWHPEVAPAPPEAIPRGPQTPPLDAAALTSEFNSKLLWIQHANWPAEIVDPQGLAHNGKWKIHVSLDHTQLNLEKAITIFSRIAFQFADLQMCWKYLGSRSLIGDSQNGKEITVGFNDDCSETKARRIQEFLNALNQAFEVEEIVPNPAGVNTTSPERWDNVILNADGAPHRFFSYRSASDCTCSQAKIGPFSGCTYVLDDGSVIKCESFQTDLQGRRIIGQLMPSYKMMNSFTPEIIAEMNRANHPGAQPFNHPEIEFIVVLTTEYIRASLRDSSKPKPHNPFPKLRPDPFATFRINGAALSTFVPHTPLSLRTSLRSPASSTGSLAASVSVTPSPPPRPLAPDVPVSSPIVLVQSLREWVTEFVADQHWNAVTVVPNSHQPLDNFIRTCQRIAGSEIPNLDGELLELVTNMMNAFRAKKNHCSSAELNFQSNILSIHLLNEVRTKPVEQVLSEFNSNPLFLGFTDDNRADLAVALLNQVQKNSTPAAEAFLKAWILQMFAPDPRGQASPLVSPLLSPKLIALDRKLSNCRLPIRSVFLDRLAAYCMEPPPPVPMPSLAVVSGFISQFMQESCDEGGKSFFAIGPDVYFGTAVSSSAHRLAEFLQRNCSTLTLGIAVASRTQYTLRVSPDGSAYYSQGAVFIQSPSAVQFTTTLNLLSSIEESVTQFKTNRATVIAQINALYAAVAKPSEAANRIVRMLADRLVDFSNTIAANTHSDPPGQFIAWDGMAFSPELKTALLQNAAFKKQLAFSGDSLQKQVQGAPGHIGHGPNTCYLASVLHSYMDSPRAKRLLAIQPGESAALLGYQAQLTTISVRLAVAIHPITDLVQRQLGQLHILESKDTFNIRNYQLSDLIANQDLIGIAVGKRREIEDVLDLLSHLPDYPAIFTKYGFNIESIIRTIRAGLVDSAANALAKVAFTLPAEGALLGKKTAWAQNLLDFQVAMQFLLNHIAVREQVLAVVARVEAGDNIESAEMDQLSTQLIQAGLIPNQTQQDAVDISRKILERLTPANQALVRHKTYDRGRLPPGYLDTHPGVYQDSDGRDTFSGVIPAAGNTTPIVSKIVASYFDEDLDIDVADLRGQQIKGHTAVRFAGDLPDEFVIEGLNTSQEAVHVQSTQFDEVLDLGGYKSMPPGQAPIALYGLTKIICHGGGGVGGHYTIFAKKSGRWYALDDMESTIRPVDFADVQRSAGTQGTVFYYQKCPPASQNFTDLPPETKTKILRQRIQTHQGLALPPTPPAPLPPAYAAFEGKVRGFLTTAPAQMIGVIESLHPASSRNGAPDALHAAEQILDRLEVEYNQHLTTFLTQYSPQLQAFLGTAQRELTQFEDQLAYFKAKISSMRQMVLADQAVIPRWNLQSKLTHSENALFVLARYQAQFKWPTERLDVIQHQPYRDFLTAKAELIMWIKSSPEANNLLFLRQKLEEFLAFAEKVSYPPPKKGERDANSEFQSFKRDIQTIIARLPKPVEAPPSAPPPSAKPPIPDPPPHLAKPPASKLPAKPRVPSTPVTDLSSSTPMRVAPPPPPRTPVPPASHFVKIKPTFSSNQNQIGRIRRRAPDVEQGRYMVEFPNGTKCFPPYAEVAELSPAEIQQAITAFNPPAPPPVGASSPIFVPSHAPSKPAAKGMASPPPPVPLASPPRRIPPLPPLPAPGPAIPIVDLQTRGGSPVKVAYIGDTPQFTGFTSKLSFPFFSSWHLFLPKEGKTTIHITVADPAHEAGFQGAFTASLTQLAISKQKRGTPTPTHLIRLLGTNITIDQANRFGLHSRIGTFPPRITLMMPPDITLDGRVLHGRDNGTDFIYDLPQPLTFQLGTAQPSTPDLPPPPRLSPNPSPIGSPVASPLSIPTTYEPQITRTPSKGNPNRMLSELIYTIPSPQTPDYEVLCHGALSEDGIKAQKESEKRTIVQLMPGKTSAQVTYKIRCGNRTIQTMHSGFSVQDSQLADTPHADDYTWKFHLSINRDDLSRAYTLLWESGLLNDIKSFKVANIYNPEGTTDIGKEIVFFICHADTQDPRIWRKRLTDIETVLQQAGIRPGPEPVSTDQKKDKKIQGLQYSYLRNEKAVRIVDSIDFSLGYIRKTDSQSQLTYYEGLGERLVLSADFSKLQDQFRYNPLPTLFPDRYSRL